MRYNLNLTVRVKQFKFREKVNSNKAERYRGYRAMSNMLRRFSSEEYKLPFFLEEGFIRRRCPICREYFWTQNSYQETCGESTSDGCACYSFLGNPPTSKKYNLSEMREAFLSFFEKQNHARIKPYPVVARWRDDIYLTHASIIDFQPYVTDGIVPPPANPLVIAQPCIRLVDISNTGPTFGRHLTIFEMGGHHAFNYPDKEVYWKDETVRYHHEFMTEVLGIKSEDITYKESFWVGGGNAGPDVESIVGGLEVGTLVFMQYKLLKNDFIKLPIRTVDTGYGLDRLAWLSQGVPSCFHAIYGKVLDKIFAMAKLEEIDDKMLFSIARHSGLVTIDKKADRLITRNKVAERVGVEVEKLEKILGPIENAFAITDHTKCLSFMLSEGIVPSNIKEGYLARMIFRRTYRLLQNLDMESEKLYEIFELQNDFWSKDYPHIKEKKEEIIDMIRVEEEKYKDTIKRGKGKVERIIDDILTKKKRRFPSNKLSELYGSHGITPETVKQIANQKGIEVKIPADFYSSIANTHVCSEKQEKKELISNIEKSKVEKLSATNLIFYDDAYIKEFEAKILSIIRNKYVILDRTAFYPEGGGQPADQGFLLLNSEKIEVVDVQKIGNVVLHKIKGSIKAKNGSMVKGILDWKKRYALMKAHTATHLINGAARRVLGDHVWQHGAQKGANISRIDITHYRRLTPSEIHKIEKLANKAIYEEIEIKTSFMNRNQAESLYGFRLYQGGSVPGETIRVVKTGDWDIEACGGTHLKNTREMGFVKIIYTERIQDGVERIGYSTGLKALENIQKNEKLLWKVSEILESSVDKLDKTAARIVKELKIANSDKRKLIKELVEKENIVTKENFFQSAKEINGIIIAERDFNKNMDIERMIQTANEAIKQNESTVTIFFGSNKKIANIVVMAGNTAVKKGVNAVEIVKKVAPIIGGGGGGKINFAQGGGPKPQNLQEAIRKAKELIKIQLEK